MNFITALIFLTNTNRATAHLTPLVETASLDRLAQFRADEIASTTFSHAGFEPAFPKMVPDVLFIGENLAEHFSDATTTEAAFMASPTHRANILNPLYYEIGVGVHGDITVVEYDFRWADLNPMFAEVKTNEQMDALREAFIAAFR